MITAICWSWIVVKILWPAEKSKQNNLLNLALCIIFKIVIVLSWKCPYVLQICMQTLSGWFVLFSDVIILTASACGTSVPVRHITKWTEDGAHWSTCWLCWLCRLCWSCPCEDIMERHLCVYWVTFSPMISQLGYHWWKIWVVEFKSDWIVWFAQNFWFIGLFFINFDLAQCTMIYWTQFESSHTCTTYKYAIVFALE